MGYPRIRSNIFNIRQCPECGGDGYVYGSYDATTDGRNYFVMGCCPICEGSGIIKNKNGNA
jgi:hypothetical protein